MAATPIADLLLLPRGERLALAMALWDSLDDEARNGFLPVDATLGAELDRRWQAHLENPAATRFSFPHHELTSRRSEAVEISAEQELAPEWLRITTATAPDKGAIKAALKAGQQIQGAQLVTRRSWSIH